MADLPGGGIGLLIREYRGRRGDLGIRGPVGVAQPQITPLLPANAAAQKTSRSTNMVSVDAIQSPESSVPVPRAATRILVVDDEPGVRSVVAKALTRAGYAVRTVGNVRDAIANCEAEAFDLLLWT